MTAGVAVMFLGSCSGAVRVLRAPLERHYSPYSTGEAQPAADSVGFVVVLGGGHLADSTLSVTSRLSDSSIKRLVEGIRIHRMHPGSKLMLSGRGATEATTARLMATLARQLGVPDGVMRVEPRARDTHEEAEELRPVLGTAPFVLVTSAVHMPRAMGMFRHLGMNPIPAPTAAGTPNGFALGQAHLAFHEYVGLLWATVQGQM